MTARARRSTTASTTALASELGLQHIEGKYVVEPGYSKCSFEVVEQFWQTLLSRPFLEHISFLVPYIPVFETTFKACSQPLPCASTYPATPRGKLRPSEPPQRSREGRIHSTHLRLDVSSVLMLHASLTSCSLLQTKTSDFLRVSGIYNARKLTSA